MIPNNKLTDPAILRYERTDEEKARRSLEGDAGAKYSASKAPAPRTDGISNTVTSATKDNVLIEPLNNDNGCSRTIKAQYQNTSAANLVRQDSFGATGVIEREPILIRQANEQGYIECPPGGVFDASYPNSPTRRGRVQDGGEVTPTICSAQQGLCLYEGIEDPSTERILQVGNVVLEHPKFKNRIPQGLSPTLNTHIEPKIAMPLYRIRKLTPRECFRLMDVDDDKIDLIQSAGISKSQQYKLAGNSIVVSCLYYIFHKMFIDTSIEKPLQLSLFDF